MGIIFLSNTMKRSSRVFSKKQVTKKQQLGHARGRSLEDHISLRNFMKKIFQIKASYGRGDW